MNTPQTDISQRIISGMMRLAGRGHDGAFGFLDYVWGAGIRWFDHADIYGNGYCETLFGEWRRSRNIPRESMVIQSKCGIRPGLGYDNSAAYMENAVDGILQRLGTDYLDILLIHRPDALWEPEEIGELFDKLQRSGKVMEFGVSNFHPAQIDYLQRHLRSKVSYNQLQLSLAFAPMVSEGLETNTYSNNGLSRSLGALDYCRANEIRIQTWSPLQFGTFQGSFIDNPGYGPLNGRLYEIARKYQVSKAAVAAAWNLRLDKNLQVVLGTVNPEHFADLLRAADVNLTREEWYGLYQSAGYGLP